MDGQIQFMIEWIEGKLKNQFSLDELSHRMGYSPYYCSFKFHQATGITIRRYIFLRRLYLSTEDLAKDRKIIDIAFGYDYSSQEAYSRAFKRVFGISPREYQLHKLPVQSMNKLTMNKNEEWCGMKVNQKFEVERLQHKKWAFFDKEVLNILNGQMMYEEFKDNRLMGDSDYAPFNEAMCVNATTSQVFDKEFIKKRAYGHQDSVENYIQKVIAPLERLFNKEYKCIVLWFGEDMFCQMNLLTILSYLEQSGYEGKVLLNSFREDEFKVNQSELQLGQYQTVYNDVLVNHKRPSNAVLPVMYQAINIYLDMLNEDNTVVKYIAKHKDLSTSELLQQLFTLFTTVGYGDTQYLQLINKVRQ
ncbi:helix-turn-helix domain-containing protein [Lysinibacillus sp. NPDC097195]|uniref:helix-turn-helix domain-containing protein n=1 Tax=Lysinibacillus sp. NPDC097195 TaxID=3364141 RepID=UPI0037FE2BF0